MSSFWKENKAKLRSLLKQGYTPSSDPLIFQELFPNKSISAISRASRRYARDILDKLQGKISCEFKEEEVNPKGPPKILIFDLETSPMEFYGWRLGKQYIRHHSVIKTRACLSWAAKWLCDDKIMSDVVSIEEARNRTDESIMKTLWELFESADILIAHNLNYFDLKMANTRFLLNNLPPFSPVQKIDTLKEVRKHFYFPSNSLKAITKELGLHEKLETNHSLWDRCVTGDKSALDEMVKYNKQDVSILEEVYFEIRPWIKSHPNVGLYVESYSPLCPNCGSYDLNWGKYYYTPTGKYKAFRCKSCGAIGRNRHTVYPKEKRSILTVSTAR
jgi:hypothetical protein